MRSLLQAVVFLNMRPQEALVLYALLVVSAGAHLIAGLALYLLPALELLTQPAPIAIEVVEIAPPEPEPPPVVEPEPEPEPEPPPPERIVRPRPTPTPEPVVEPQPPTEEPTADPAPAEEQIADFTGTTLTNADADWATNAGNGEAIEGPIGGAGGQVTGRNRRGTAGGTPGGSGEEEGPAIVARGDLSRQPGPPVDRLRDLLQDNYPREARQLGVEGHADVRVLVNADGSVRVLRISSETYEGFGDACRRTVRQGGRWSPPLDRQGREVATVTLFRCTFTVRF